MTSSAEGSGGTRGNRRCRLWLRRAAVGLAGLVISALLISTAFFHIRISGRAIELSPRFALWAWLSTLPAHWPWVTGFALLTATVIPLRALQWRFTLGEEAPTFANRYHAVAIGAFFHNVLPGKPGELVRAFMLARRDGLPFFHSLGSVLICKLLELIALIMVVLLALAGPLGAAASTRLAPAVAIAAALGILLGVAAIAAGRCALPIASRLERAGRMPRLREALVHLGAGLKATGSVRRVGLALAASFGPVCASALAYGVALHALGVRPGIVAGGVVVGAISLGQLTPGLPVGVGMYYLTSSWAARALGASAAQAAAFAALTHVATCGTQILVGLVSVLLNRIHPRELLRRHKELLAAGHVRAAAPLRQEPAL